MSARSVPGQREVGSAFPLFLPDAAAPAGGDGGLPSPLRLYGSGRQALRALLDAGRREHGWTAVHLPTYYCADVAEAVADLMPVRPYPAGPYGVVAPPAPDRSEVVVSVCYFGVAPPPLPRAGSALIVDATHDPLAPWLAGTGADYVFASLRKTLPVPDGGAVWSLSGRPLPAAAPLTPGHQSTVGLMLSAMALKSAYLAGSAVAKERYLELYGAAEERLRTTEVSDISAYSRHLIPALPLAALRERRAANTAELVRALGAVPGARVRPTPLGVVLEFGSPARRENVRRGLIAEQVYPAVLWPLGSAAVPPRDVDLSGRILLLHTDFRWAGPDLLRVAALVRRLRPASTGRAVTSPAGGELTTTGRRDASPALSDHSSL
ncbi:hypothetical protein [Micromonospora aurantiaca (nom. illeg.)]